MVLLFRGMAERGDGRPAQPLEAGVRINLAEAIEKSRRRAAMSSLWPLLAQVSDEATK